MDQVMGIVKLNFLKKEVEEFGKQSKYFGHENRRLEHKVKILKDQNGVCECIIASYSISISQEKIDQVISVILSKLVKKNTERFRSGGVKAKNLQYI